MTNWYYPSLKKKVLKVEDIPNYEEVIGFIYRITNLKTGKFYIGQKSLYHKRKTRISKREKTQTGTRKIFKQTVKESDWMTYYGSSVDLKEDVARMGPENFKREILEVCCTKKYLNYCELSHQVKNDVLKANTYNGNILGRYFARDMENCKC